MSKNKSPSNSSQHYNSLIESQDLTQNLTQSTEQKSEHQKSKQKQKEQKEKQIEEEKKKDQQQRQFSWPMYKKLLGYTKKKIWLGVSGFTMSILAALLNNLLPWQIGQYFDGVIAAKDKDTGLDAVYWTLMLMLAIVIGMGITEYFRVYFMSKWEQHIEIDIKNDIYAAFMKHDLSFFEEYKTGELISRLFGDTGAARAAISSEITGLIKAIFQTVFNLVILFLISWQLTLIMMVVLPVYAVTSKLYTNRTKVLITDNQKISAEIYTHTTERFSGIQVVKAYCSEEKEIDQYKNNQIRNFKIGIKMVKLRGLYNSFNLSFPCMAILVALFMGAKLIVEGHTSLSAGQLTAFVIYCRTLGGHGAAIAGCWSSIINGTHTFKKVLSMSQYPRKLDEYEGQEIEFSGDVEFKAAVFQYPTGVIPVLNGLDLSIKGGEYVAFVGQSGSGKSTIVKLIERFYKLNSGQIYLDGHNSQQVKATHLRKQIGIVTQEAILFSGTVEENIAYGLEKYTEDELEEAAQKSGCLEFLNNEERFPLRLQTVVGEKGANFSGGQRQRISIARALMRKPQMIIFDEATSSLDANSEAMVQESIQQIANHKSNNVTIIVIAHRLSTVIKADRIYAMKNGQIVESGNHKELIALQGYYYELVQKQLTNKE